MRAAFTFRLSLILLPLLSACGNDNKIETKNGAATEHSAAREPLQIIMLGPPGCGKGTQARLIEKEFSIPYISESDILRVEIDGRTKIGEEIEDELKRGAEIPGDILFPLVTARLIEDDCRNGFILDGFPRTAEEAEELDDFLRRRGRETLHVIYLMVTEEISLKRLMAKRRLEENEDFFRDRIRAYHARTAPLIDYYFEKGAIIRINGVQSTEDVFREIEERLDALTRR